MENVEEAVVHPNGSVTIRYYFGKVVTIPVEVMDEIYYDGLYDTTIQDRLLERKKKNG